MDMTGTQRIEVPRAAVWAASNDPEVLKRCIPGCERIEKFSDIEMNARVNLKIGPVQASFMGKVKLVQAGGKGPGPKRQAAG
jgi:carbon monoxide dehydrogenase subunit G